MDNQQTLKTVTNLTALINGHLAGLDRERENLGKTTEMLTDILANDPTYKETTDKAKEVAKEKAKAKANILQQPTAHDLAFKIKDGRIEIKQLSLELSGFLTEYQKLTGSNEFESEDGEIRRIVSTAKLVGKTNFNDQEEK
ncbi:MAG: hypothetical protein AAB548_03155 [Patescibacteria group bacterium]